MLEFQVVLEKQLDINVFYIKASKMKKRHQQKLILLSITLVVLLNLPLLFIYNKAVIIFGIPLFYISIFFIWLVSSCISYIILRRFHG